MAVAVVEKTDRATLTGFVADHTVDETAMVFTDEHAGLVPPTPFAGLHRPVACWSEVPTVEELCS